MAFFFFSNFYSCDIPSSGAHPVHFYSVTTCETRHLFRKPKIKASIVQYATEVPATAQKEWPVHYTSRAPSSLVTPPVPRLLSQIVPYRFPFLSYRFRFLPRRSRLSLWPSLRSRPCPHLCAAPTLSRSACPIISESVFSTSCPDDFPTNFGTQNQHLHRNPSSMRASVPPFNSQLLSSHVFTPHTTSPLDSIHTLQSLKNPCSSGDEVELLTEFLHEYKTHRRPQAHLGAEG